MYTLIRLREGVKAHGLAGRTAKAIAPYLGKPATAKTMPPAFVPISVASVTFTLRPLPSFWGYFFFGQRLAG